MSAFSKVGVDLIYKGYSCIPILPGEKRPGRFINGNWVGMSGWQKYCSQLPTRFEFEHWDNNWPDAGVCVCLGQSSSIIAIDLDYGSDSVREAIESILPKSPVKKRGAKGYTAFYKYSGEKPKKWFINGQSVCELLSQGNQTVLPPTLHPDGMEYKYITQFSLYDFDADDLPSLPEDFISQMTAILDPFSDDTDRSRNQRDVKRRDPDPDGEQSEFEEINSIALANLDLWVPELFPQTSKRHDGSYRVVAHWRGVDNPNLSIHPEGHMDWGAGIGHTSIDIVMLALSVDIMTAVRELKKWLKMEDDSKMFDGVALPSFTTNVPVEVEERLNTSNAFENPPGILNDICEWMERTAPRPQPVLYLAAALSMLGAVMGRKYQTPSGLRTNLYCLSIAPSGAGKNHAIGCVDKILTTAGLDDYLGGNKIGSGPGMIAAVARHPAILFQLDEFGMMMQHMADSNRAPAHLRQILDNMTELYSSASRRFRGIEYADDKRERQEIEHPNMCIHGLSTPTSFYSSLSSANSLEGSLSRLLIFQTSDIPYAQTSIAGNPPATIVDHLIQINEIGEEQIRRLGAIANQRSAPAPLTVPLTEEANQYVDQLSRSLVDKQRKITGTVVEPILTRIVENSLKVALVGAGSVDPVEPVIDLKLIQWAHRIAERCAESLTDSLDTYLAENQIEAERKKMRLMIRKNQPMTKTDIVQKSRHLDRRKREELLADMVEHGELVVELKDGQSRKVTLYSATK